MKREGYGNVPFEVALSFFYSLFFSFFSLSPSFALGFREETTSRGQREGGGRGAHLRKEWSRVASSSGLSLARPAANRVASYFHLPRSVSILSCIYIYISISRSRKISIAYNIRYFRNETIVNPSPSLIVEPSLLYIFIKPMTSV